jgi:hypothetical protein
MPSRDPTTATTTTLAEQDIAPEQEDWRVVLGMGSQCRVAARLLREWLESVSSGRAPWGRHSNLWPSRVKIFAQLLAPGAASLHITPPQEAAQLPAAAAAALRRHLADFPDREAAAVAQHPEPPVAWLPEPTRRPGTELDNLIAQPVELGDDADR